MDRDMDREELIMDLGGVRSIVRKRVEVDGRVVTETVETTTLTGDGERRSSRDVRSRQRDEDPRDLGPYADSAEPSDDSVDLDMLAGAVGSEYPLGDDYGW